MGRRLHEIVAAEERELAERLFHRLRRSGQVHYERAADVLLRERCERILRELVGSLRDSPSRLRNYMLEIAAQRIAEGYRLKELLTALAFLEKDVWKLCAREVEDRDELLRSLATVTTTIGWARDALAEAYAEFRQCLLPVAVVQRARADEPGEGACLAAQGLD
jgi:hypothetical protein